MVLVWLQRLDHQTCNQGRGGGVGGSGDPAFVRVTINDPLNPTPSIVYNYPYTGADQSLTLPSHGT